MSTAAIAATTTRVVTYPLADGRRVRVEVSVAVARAIDSTRRAADRNGHTSAPFSEIGIDVENIADREREPLELPRPPEDHPLREVWEWAQPFRLILGTNIVGWAPCIESGVRPCPVCRGRRLPPRALCLACLRTDFELSIPSVPREQAPKVLPDARHGLGGGLGPAVPARTPPPEPRSRPVARGRPRGFVFRTGTRFRR